MAKKIISALSTEIQNYAAKTEPLSIDPILDGGIKQDILDTLNNKAYNSAYLRLSALPTNVFLTPADGNNGEYSIYTQAPSACTLLKKEAGVWNVVSKTNEMVFFFDAVDGTRYYYAFSDDLKNPIQTHSINFANPTGTAVLTTPQTLTNEEKTQVQINIDAASKSYIDNALAALKNSGAVGSSIAGSVMPWFGIEATIPQDWILIPNVETFLLKADYPDLYTALGGEDNVFGVTDTLFALPYLVGGTSIVQTGELFTLGQKGGEENHVLDVTEIPEHSHIINLDTVDGVEETGIKAVNANTIAGGSVQTETSGGGLAHNNMPPYIAANYIIKTKNTGGAYVSNHNELEELQGGTVEERYHLPLKNYNDIVGTVQTIDISEPSYTLTNANNAYIILNIDTLLTADFNFLLNNTISTSGTTTIVLKNASAYSCNVTFNNPTGNLVPSASVANLTSVGLSIGSYYLIKITTVENYTIIQ